MPQWLMNLSLIVVSAVLGLSVSEAYLRMTGFSYPSLYVMDEVTGHRLRPAVEGWFREEGEAYIKINRDGLRDREHAKEKPAGTTRIAIIGDSYAEALQVPQEDTFWSVIEREVNTCHAFGSRKAEVMNFEVSGYGTAQELLLLRDRVWQYVPDIVILAFTAGNDVRDNSKVLSNSLPRPYFVHENGSLTLDESFTKAPIYRLKRSWIWTAVQKASDSLKIFQLLNLVLNRVNQARQGNFQQSEGAAGLEPGLDDSIYLESAGAEWQEAWRVTEELILSMHDEVVNRGAQFLLVTLSSGIQVNPSRMARVSFVGKLQVNDLFYPERRLQNFGVRQKLNVVTLAPQLLDYAEEHGTFLHGFNNTPEGRGHWNEEGHRVAGQLISNYFCSRAR